MPIRAASSRPSAPILLALLAILLWSALATLTVQLRGLPPFLLAGITLLIGSLTGLGRGRPWRASLPVAALGVYGLFAYHAALFTALRLAPPVEANLLNYLWPLLIVVLTPAFLPGRRLSRRQVAGALAGFAGAALLVSGGGPSAVGAAPGSRRLAGLVLAAIAALVWSTFSLASARRGAGATSPVGLYGALSGALALLCHVLFEARAPIAAADLPWLLLLGLGPMGLAFQAWDAALRRGDPRTIGVLAYLTPLLSTLLLALAGGGHVTAATAGAMVLIVGGALLGSGPVEFRKRRDSGGA